MRLGRDRQRQRRGQHVDRVIAARPPTDRTPRLPAPPDPRRPPFPKKRGRWVRAKQGEHQVAAGVDVVHDHEQFAETRAGRDSRRRVRCISWPAREAPGRRQRCRAPNQVPQFGGAAIADRRAPTAARRPAARAARAASGAARVRGSHRPAGLPRARPAPRRSASSTRRGMISRQHRRCEERLDPPGEPAGQRRSWPAQPDERQQQPDDADRHRADQQRQRHREESRRGHQRPAGGAHRSAPAVESRGRRPAPQPLVLPETRRCRPRRRNTRRSHRRPARPPGRS